MKAQLSPMALNETEFSAEMADFLFRGNGLELGGLTDQAKDDPQPLSIQITGIGSDQWQLFCGPLVLKKPSIIQIPAIRADISRTPEGWRFAGRLKTLLPEQVLTEEWRLNTDQPLTVQWQFQANQEGRSRINYRLKGDTETALPFSLVREPVTIKGNGFHVEATGWVIEHTMNTKVIASTGPVEINAPPNRLHIPEVTLSADTQLTDKLRADSEITLSKPVITRDALSGGASSARISALVEIASNPDPKVTGAVGLTAGYIEDPKQNLSIRGIDVKMPFGLPIMDTQPVGTFRAKALRWHTYEKGRVKGDLVQTKGRLEINARYSSQLRPGLQMDVNGWIGQAGGRLAVEIPPYQPEKEIDLGQFVSSAAGFSAKGSLAGTGDFKIEPDGLKGSALITITNASLSQKDDALSIEGVSASLLMPQLPDLRSAPRQPLSADHIQLGEISAHDFNAFFQIEPPGTLFIEKADVQWCNGGIHTQSIRLHPDKQDIELTLFANQLNLAQVLEQLGVTEGEGEGAVNGRIPLRLHEGMPIFDNGFLYSTPGQGGTIHLRDTNSLLQGMPREAPQFIQLDIATEALKDYTYDWARLSLNSENDILKVGLKLKGKPNKLLPFTYDKETEQFRRINGEPIAEFQEIGFDLNFSSSLSQILQYKKMLNKK